MTIKTALEEIVSLSDHKHSLLYAQAGAFFYGAGTALMFSAIVLLTAAHVEWAWVAIAVIGFCFGVGGAICYRRAMVSLALAFPAANAEIEAMRK